MELAWVEFFLLILISVLCLSCLSFPCYPQRVCHLVNANLQPLKRNHQEENLLTESFFACGS